MFDDIAQKEQADRKEQGGVPSGSDLPNIGTANNGKSGKAVEDIFSETDETAPAADFPFKKVGPENAVHAAAPEAASKGAIIRKTLVIAGILTGLVFLGAVGYRGYGYIVNWLTVAEEEDEGDTETADNGGTGIAEEEEEEDNFYAPGEETTIPAEEEAEEILPAPAVTDLPPVSQDGVVTVDTDGDGLSDEEERTLGTDPFNPDTDDDGLFDYEEVRTYKTDPLNPDTDGDGYTDGEEVANRFNPKGAGKLFGD